MMTDQQTATQIDRMNQAVAGLMMLDRGLHEMFLEDDYPVPTIEGLRGLLGATRAVLLNGTGSEGIATALKSAMLALTRDVSLVLPNQAAISPEWSWKERATLLCLIDMRQARLMERRQKPEEHLNIEDADRRIRTLEVMRQRLFNLSAQELEHGRSFFTEFLQ